MNSGFRLWVPILLVSAVFALGLAPSANADAIYTLSNSVAGFSWSFEVPAIITTDTTITSFLSTNIDPNGFFGSHGCTAINSVQIFAPSSLGDVRTDLSPSCTDDSVFGPITSFGAFGIGDFALLTISPSGVPEPSSLLLLAGGLTGLLGLRQKRT